MIEEIFYLDLNQVTLLGWERSNLFSKIEGMVKAIENGDEDFPPVLVEKIDDATYALTHHSVKPSGGADGGHHRAIAHYIANKLLKCRIVEGSHIKSRVNGIFKDYWGFTLYPISQAYLVDKLPKSIPVTFWEDY